MKRKINIEASIQFIILISIAFLLIYAMLSKKINYYVHPRFYIGLWITIIILILFALSLISKIGKARHNVNIKHYLIFVIPIAMALIFPSAGVISKDMSMGESNLLGATSEQQVEEKTMTSVFKNESTENSDSKEDASEKYEQYKVGDVVVIKDDVFADWFFDTYAHLDNFVGKRYQYLAQVYSKDDFKEDQFLAGRNFMVCCAADLAGYGIMCESNRRSELTDEEWVTVTGTISAYQYNDHLVPMFNDVTITKAEAPEVGYIYYKNY
ncbi:TIGR03943 family putative permease subunit [Acetobacterium woodii]|nr:TIGR03943 family protein [Acetobacterium woodii]